MKHKLTVLLTVFLFGFTAIAPAYGQAVVINELCVSPPDPAGATNANSLYNMTEQPPDNKEWIELYNTTCAPVDISCYTLGSNAQRITSLGTEENWGAFTFPSGTIIPPFGFLIIGGNHAQVPVLNFDMNAYRNSTFGVQYLDGYSDRWFLRNEYGWLAFYDPNGVPVDAVYWDAYGNPANLGAQNEYQHAIVTTTTCHGIETLAAAASIPGIEYVGACLANTYTSFQRVTDGSLVWSSTPITATPAACNGPCVIAPLLNITPHSASCAGNDGSLTLTITDGHTGPYTINWLNPAGLHASILNNLTPGTYIVQVVDATSCFTVYDTVTINELPQPTVAFSNVHNETCTASNGTITAMVTNGNLPINYNWSTTPPAVSQTVSNLPAGTYQVTITDHLGCTATNTITLINSPGPQINIDSVKNEMCSAADAAIYSSPNGGTLPYTYAWNSSPVQYTQNLTGVHAGNYTITVTDSNGCMAQTDTTLTDTPPPHVAFINIQYDTCNKGTGAAEVLASGGHPPYAYNWNNNISTNDFISHMGEGTYTVSVTDSFCTTVASVLIPNIPGPQADYSFYPPVATIEDPVFRFQDASVGQIDHWFWDFGDNTYSDEQSPFHTYTDVGTYHVLLVITNDYGCRDSIFKTIIVITPITLFVPNCFTPNGDGKNDRFRVYSENICDFDLYLYDRWGEMIYHSNDPEAEWNGNYKGVPAAEGVYSWVIFYSEDWAEILKIPKSLKGSLTIIR